MNRAYGLGVLNGLVCLASLWAVTRILHRRRHASRGTPSATDGPTPVPNAVEHLRFWVLALSFAGAGVFAIWSGLQKEGSSGVVPTVLGAVLLVSVCGISHRWHRYLRSR